MNMTTTCCRTLLMATLGLAGIAGGAPTIGVGSVPDSPRVNRIEHTTGVLTSGFARHMHHKEYLLLKPEGYGYIDHSVIWSHKSAGAFEHGYTVSDAGKHLRVKVWAKGGGLWGARRDYQVKLRITYEKLTCK